MLDPRELEDDDDAWLVYADELQAAGDPRGELVIVQLRLQATPDDAELRAREQALFAEHADQLLGPIGLAWKPVSGAVEGRGVELEWRRGFVRRMRLRSEFPELSELLSHPSLQLLESLHLAEPAYGREQHYDPYAVDLAVLEPRLRELAIGPYLERSPSWAGPGYVFIDVDISAQYLGTLGPIWSALPTLERLAVIGNHVDFGTLTLPALRTFEHVTSSLGKSQLQAIRRAHWPKLERLEVWFGDGEYGGGDCGVGDVRDLLAHLATATPDLRELAIVNCPFVDELCGILGGPTIDRLRALDVSHGNLHRRGIAALAKLLPKLPELRALNVAASPIDDRMLEPLRAAAPHVELAAGRLHGPDRRRYCAISE